MRGGDRLLGIGAPLALVAMGLAAGAGPLQAQEDAHAGQAVYERWCAGCHGVEGDGEGPAAAWMMPRPRDFTDALYQIRTTPSGALPTDADIMHVIDRGMPGTAMPGWEDRLSRREREAVLDYLKTFSRFFEMEDAPAPVEIGGAPRTTAEAIENGRRLYQEIECWKCHGQEGRGDGESAPTQTDELGYPIRPADLTENWLFDGGGSLEAIYTRLLTGLDGTPMPSFADLVVADVITEEELWHLAMYVRSLSPERTPEAREVVRATLVEGELPSSPDDAGWEAAEPYHVPLVGQIIREPRWFAPTVDGIWVEALHNGEELAMRLSWSDPSESPDPAWSEWRALVGQHVEPAPETGGGQGPDALTVQFPTSMPDERDLPYFFGGDDTRPVYLWQWRSDTDGVEEAVGRGAGSVEPLPTVTGSPAARAAFSHGRWRLVIRRALATDDPGRRMTMPEGAAIPMAFFARDGSNGETELRGSLSTWYYLWLDRPLAARVYILPVAATALTALLCLLLVARAQRVERRRSTASTDTDTLLEGA